MNGQQSSFGANLTAPFAYSPNASLGSNPLEIEGSVQSYALDQPELMTDERGSGYYAMPRSPRSLRIGSGVKRSHSYAQRSTMGERMSTTGSLGGPSTAHLSQAAATAISEKRTQDSKYIERDVQGNFLTESHFYRGFYYMMKPSSSALGASLRENLFPQLTLALEAVLHDLVVEQLAKETEARKLQQKLLHQNGEGGSSTGSHLGNKHKSWRQHPTYPTQAIRNPSVHPVLMLARELKKRSKKAQAERQEGASGDSNAAHSTSEGLSTPSTANTNGAKNGLTLGLLGLGVQLAPQSPTSMSTDSHPKLVESDSDDNSSRTVTPR
jgi:hypothetical protein